MLCPKCHTEYREEFSICADCNIELTAEIPSQPTENIENQQPIEWVEIKSDLRQDEISMIRSVFDANEVHYQIDGERFGTFIRASNFIRLLVDKNDFEKATDILKNLI